MGLTRTAMSTPLPMLLPRSGMPVSSRLLLSTMLSLRHLSPLLLLLLPLLLPPPSLLTPLDLPLFTTTLPPTVLPPPTPVLLPPLQPWLPPLSTPCRLSTPCQPPLLSTHGR